MKPRLLSMVAISFLFVVFGLQKVTTILADEPPDQARCPIVSGTPQVPSGRPSIQKPFSGNPPITNDSGEGYHRDSWYHEYYAIDYQGTFDVLAAASGTIAVTKETSATVAWIDHGNGWYTKYHL